MRDESFEDLYELAPVGQLSTTADGIITRVNRTLLNRLGLATDAVVGSQFGELCDVGSRMFYETRYLNVLRLAGSVLEVALTLRCADGSLLPVLVNAVATEDGGSVRVAIFEATERHDYERDLLNARRNAEASEARVRVLQDASSAFGAAVSEDALAAALVASALEAFSATSAAVLLVDDTGELRLVAGVHPIDGPVLGERPELDALASGRVIAIGNDAHGAYPDVISTLRDARLESLTATPLLGDAAALGVLVCFFGRAREFDAHAIELHEALARQAAQVLGRIRLQGQLEHNAQHDLLTGLANRQLLRLSLTNAIAVADDSSVPIAMIFLDLDGFKAVNDVLGHSVGDGVLREVASRLRTGVRDDDVIGRFGGDEFVIICANATEHDAARIAERVLQAVREPYPGVPAEHPLSASVGVALYQPAPGATTVTNDALFRVADDAMYASKRRGKDAVTVARA